MYAVVFTYSFDSDCAIYPQKSLEDAVDFLRKSYIEEMRIDVEENGWLTEGKIEEDGMYAEIRNDFGDRVDVTMFHIGCIFD